MDPLRFRNAYQKLRSLDERLRYRIRPQPTLSRLSTEQIEDRLNALSHYTTELGDVVEELFLAIGSKSTESKD